MTKRPESRYRASVHQAERKIIEFYLDQCDGAIAPAARLMEMDPAWLRRKMKKLGMDRPSKKSPASAPPPPSPTPPPEPSRDNVVPFGPRAPAPPAEADDAPDDITEPLPPAADSHLDDDAPDDDADDTARKAWDDSNAHEIETE